MVLKVSASSPRPCDMRLIFLNPINKGSFLICCAVDECGVDWPLIGGERNFETNRAGTTRSSHMRLCITSICKKLARLDGRLLTLTQTFDELLGVER